ncbi:hypothetical protein [Streptomyces sp. NPDC088762]|uniref:hypothetical protein n=1 Tax=Streptomyces sp. NPDC088762 TaxID=3365891 RepID=UPI0037FC007A
MSRLTALAKEMIQTISEGDIRRVREAEWKFTECVTFADADEILSMLHEVMDEEWMAMMPWARNLSYRLACLQRPDDPALLREAGLDLDAFGPDWDDIAAGLMQRADQLEAERDKHSDSESG